MRIISGKFRSRRLEVPSDIAIRPSSDRIRSGVFSALDSLGVLPESTVLDLFAGSGSYGFEALSRGAAHVTLVEKEKVLVDGLHKSAKQLGIEADVDIVSGTLPAALAKVADGARRKAVPGFDVVFADPPYAIVADWLPNLLAEYMLVRADSILVYESRKTTPAFPDGLVPELDGLMFESFKERIYGDSAVRYYRWR